MPATQPTQLTSAVTVQPTRRVPAGHTSEALQAVQVPPSTRATACVDHVEPATHATQLVSAAAEQTERVPAAHVLAEQLLHELALATTEKVEPSTQATQAASAPAVQVVR